MKALKHLSLAVALTLVGGGVARAQPQAAPPRQDYSKSWEQHKSGEYYFLVYWFKPDPDQKEYNRFLTIYYPSRPGYFYYFNPATDTYWGRYNLNTRHFELLEDNPRNKRLADIADSAFHEMKEMPRIPNARDDATVNEPPLEKIKNLPGKPTQDKFSKPGP